MPFFFFLKLPQLWIVSVSLWTVVCQNSTSSHETLLAMLLNYKDKAVALCVEMRHWRLGSIWILLGWVVTSQSLSSWPERPCWDCFRVIFIQLQPWGYFNSLVHFLFYFYFPPTESLKVISFQMSLSSKLKILREVLSWSFPPSIYSFLVVLLTLWL